METYRVVYIESIKTSDSRSVVAIPTTFDVELHQLDLYPPPMIDFRDIPQRGIKKM
jgi:hypothetical protein